MSVRLYTWLQVIDDQGTMQTVREPRLRGNIYKELLYGNFIGTPSTVIAKREYIERTEGFDTQLSCCGDWDMWLQLARYCEFDFIPEPLVQYRNHSGDWRGSTNSNAIVEGHLIFLKKYHSQLLDGSHSDELSRTRKSRCLF